MYLVWTVVLHHEMHWNSNVPYFATVEIHKIKPSITFLKHTVDHIVCIIIIFKTAYLHLYFARG